MSQKYFDESVLGSQPVSPNGSMPTMDNQYPPMYYNQPPASYAEIPGENDPNFYNIRYSRTMSNPDNPNMMMEVPDATSAYNPNFSDPFPTPRKRRTDTQVAFDGPAFSETTQFYRLVAADHNKVVNLKLHPKIDRGFFLSDNDWTCYRRNYFQVSTTFSLFNGFGENEVVEPLWVDVEGDLQMISQYQVAISSKIQNTDKHIDLVQHTAKRDKGPQSIPGLRSIRPGGTFELASIEATQTLVCFERLQFKSATANNGKRRAAQQYFVLECDLYANTDRGEQIHVASCISAPLVVRGRSPGHYADGAERDRAASDERFFGYTGGAMAPMPASHFTPYASQYAYPQSYAQMTPFSGGMPMPVAAQQMNPMATPSYMMPEINHSQATYHQPTLHQTSDAWGRPELNDPRNVYM